MYYKVSSVMGQGVTVLSTDRPQGTFTQERDSGTRKRSTLEV